MTVKIAGQSGIEGNKSMETAFFLELNSPRGGGGDSQIKQTGMLIVSLWGVNSRCLVSLWVFRAVKVSFRAAHEEI